MSVIALDYGDVRIGIAIASYEARLASPLTTLKNDDEFMTRLKDIIGTESVDTIVVGYPRGMDGQTTDQTRKVDNFLETLKDLGIKLFQQDEALTSVKAEDELSARSTSYTKEDVDALAATYILEDWLNTHER